MSNSLIYDERMERSGEQEVHFKVLKLMDSAASNSIFAWLHILHQRKDSCNVSEYGAGLRRVSDLKKLRRVLGRMVHAVDRHEASGGHH